MTLTADELLQKMAETGGVVIGTDMLTPYEIAVARAGGMMYVTDDALGFVVVPKNVVKSKLTAGDER
jgi:hypothetical protein